MKKVFAPGCALTLYKPVLSKKIVEMLKKELGEVDEYLTCCRVDPRLPEETQIITACPKCSRGFADQGRNVVSLWEVLAESKTFPFPDYQGQEMSILDPCPVRNRDEVHEAVRTLLKKMNINIIEPAKTRDKSVCCGDSFYEVLPLEQVKALMKKRAGEMPVDEVVTYCVSCSESLHVGGRRARYIIDLLLGGETAAGTSDLEEWRAELDQFVFTNILNS